MPGGITVAVLETFLLVSKEIMFQPDRVERADEVGDRAVPCRNGQEQANLCFAQEPVSRIIARQSMAVFGLRMSDDGFVINCRCPGWNDVLQSDGRPSNLLTPLFLYTLHFLILKGTLSFGRCIEYCLSPPATAARYTCFPLCPLCYSSFSRRSATACLSSYPGTQRTPTALTAPGPW